jgi:hypothetical protein
MNRRELLKLISMGALGHALDVDKLLWIPGQKTIFLPPVRPGMDISQIVAIELERILPKVRDLFTRDTVFYEHILKELDAPDT